MQISLQNLSPISHPLEWPSWFMCNQGSYPWDNQLLGAKRYKKMSISALGMGYILGNSSEVKFQCYHNRPHIPDTQLDGFLVPVSKFPNILWNLSWKFLDLQYSYFAAHLQLIHHIYTWYIKQVCRKRHFFLPVSLWIYSVGLFLLLLWAISNIRQSQSSLGHI